MISRPVEREEALVLGSSTYQEDSAIVTVATPTGLKGLLCRGIHKPKSALKPLLVTGTLVEVEYALTEKGPYLARSLNVLQDHSAFLLDYPKSTFLLLLEELTLDLFHYGDSYPFAETKTLLQALENGGNLLTIALLYLGTLYQHLGLEMEIRECINCHKSQDIVSFSFREGGFICKDCLSLFPGLEIRNALTLYVLKFVFLPLSNENLKRVVPMEEGKMVFLELVDYLRDYFDLREIRTSELFIHSISAGFMVE